MRRAMWYLNRLVCAIWGHHDYPFSDTVTLCRRCWRVIDTTTGEVTLAL